MTRRGGRRPSSIRSTPGRSPTPTGTASGTSRGIIDHLDHLQWLGVDGIWLSPITVSPNADWGYDVADFCAVQPDLGTMAEFDLLVGRPADAISGCCSTSSPTTRAWSTRGSWTPGRRGRPRQRDWYVWADPGPTAARPTTG